MKTVRLTTSQALVRYLMAQNSVLEGESAQLFAGVFAIFGHGNVAGLGEALFAVRDRLPTYRAHNEQAMAHAAIAYARTMRRRRMMVCTSSVGPGATNMVTAAAVAHTNRLPVLFLPGDTFANRRPDPVLQQIENFESPTLLANDCFRPVSRYWDRIMRPEQLLTSLPQAIRVLTDPAECGPVTLCLPQDVQAEAYDYPLNFFEPRDHRMRRQLPDEDELKRAAELLSVAKSPLIVAGGGVIYAGAEAALAEFAAAHGIPVGVTQAGKAAILSAHPCAVGGVGVTGTAAANHFASKADLILAVGTRLADFTTGSRSLFANPERRIVSINVAAGDAWKHGSLPVVGDARLTLEQLARMVPTAAPASKLEEIATVKASWMRELQAQLREQAGNDKEFATDAQIVQTVNRAAGENGIVVCAAGGLPGELHKLWEVLGPGTYHVEYGYSCMGYEIAGGLGVKMAVPGREVYVMLGDGSYLMMNSEIATSVLLGAKLTILLVDNGGYGCINRLQKACVAESFNNLFDRGTRIDGERPVIDFAAHAASLGANALKVADISSLDAALAAAREAKRTTVIVIETDPSVSTEAGGHWWDVPVAAVSEREAAHEIHRTYIEQGRKQRHDG